MIKHNINTIKCSECRTLAFRMTKNYKYKAEPVQGQKKIPVEFLGIEDAPSPQVIQKALLEAHKGHGAGKQYKQGEYRLL